MMKRAVQERDGKWRRQYMKGIVYEGDRREGDCIQKGFYMETVHGDCTWRELYNGDCTMGTVHGDCTWGLYMGTVPVHEEDWTWRTLYMKGTVYEGTEHEEDCTQRGLNMGTVREGYWTYAKGTVHEGDCTWRGLYLYIKGTVEHMMETHSTGRELHSMEAKVHIMMYLYNTKLYCSRNW